MQQRNRNETIGAKLERTERTDPQKTRHKSQLIQQRVSGHKGAQFVIEELTLIQFAVEVCERLGVERAVMVSARRGSNWWLDPPASCDFIGGRRTVRRLASTRIHSSLHSSVPPSIHPSALAAAAPRWPPSRPNICSPFSTFFNTSIRFERTSLVV